MKKVLILILLLLFVLLGSTYVVGTMTQNELYKQVQQSKNRTIPMELMSYHKSFFRAKAEIKISIPVEGQAPIQVLVNSDITHYPYKAKAITQFSLLDIKKDKKLTTFFQTKDWLTSQEEITLLGDVSGKVTLAEGMFKSHVERFNTAPLQMFYQYSLSDKLGSLAINWPGLSGQVHDQIFSVDTVLVNASFAKVNDSSLIDYHYQAQIDQLKFIRAPQHLSLKEIDLVGKNEVDKGLLTVDTENNWQIKEFQNGQQIFMNNHIKLLLSELNLEALFKFKESISNPQFIHQALSHLASLGLRVNLQTLQSETPWGRVDGRLILDIQRGLAATDILNNPLSLIDYTNGELNLTLPQALLQQPNVGNLVKIGVQRGVLKKEKQQLTLQSSLDRGELIVNGHVIPM